MKQLTFIMFLGLVFACRENHVQSIKPIDAAQLSEIDENQRYPEAMRLVLEAHGGIEQWRKQRTLSYQFPREKGTEKQTIDLFSRKDRIEGPDYIMGFDGVQVWLKDPQDRFDGDPVFYHNLMFYFYAMPFVLADDGINYDETETLEFEGKTYPGIRISYGSDVGTSPKDEYFLYYEPDTHTMAWLGYTVTYFSDTPSDDVHWIRYDDWNKVNGLLLPASLSWYNYKGGKIKDARNTVPFNEVKLMEQPMEKGFYAPPAGAEIVN